MKPLILMLIFLGTPQSFAQTKTTGVASTKTGSGKPWFHMEKVFSGVPEGTSGHVVFRDERGELLSEERATVSASHVLQSYDWKQFQEAHEFHLKQVGNKWEMSFDGKKKSLKMPEVPESVVVPPLIAERLIAEWTKKDNLKEFSFELLVPDRMETFSFVFKKKQEKDGLVHWLLFPTNFFVKLVAGEIEFIFSTDKVLKEVRDFRPPVKFKTKTGEFSDQKTSILF